MKVVLRLLAGLLIFIFLGSVNSSRNNIIANGGDCEGAQAVDLTGSDNLISFSTPSGQVVSSVCVKVTPDHIIFSSDGSNGCYTVSGIGTNSVNVVRTGEPSSTCQEMSHLDVYYNTPTPTPTVVEPEPTSTPTPTPIESVPTPTPTDIQIVLPILPIEESTPSPTVPVSTPIESGPTSTPTQTPVQPEPTPHSSHNSDENLNSGGNTDNNSHNSSGGNSNASGGTNLASSTSSKQATSNKVNLTSNSKPQVLGASTTNSARVLPEAGPENYLFIPAFLLLVGGLIFVSKAVAFKPAEA